MNAGIDTEFTNGNIHKLAIYIETVIGDSYSAPYQKVNNVIIRNNVELGSANGGFVAYDGDNILSINQSIQ